MYEAIPDELQRVVDIEVGKPGSNLRLYPQWIEFIKDWSRSHQFQHGYEPTPLMANLVDADKPIQPVQNPEQPQYFSDQWIAWLQEDEGKGYVAQRLPLPTEGMEALYAVMRKAKVNGIGKVADGKSKARPAKR